MDRENPLRGLPARFKRYFGSPFADLSSVNKKVLTMVVLADVAGVATGYFLVAVGVTTNVGPFTTALVILVFGLPVHWLVFRPSLRNWLLWRPALLLGVCLGANNIGLQHVLRWVPLIIMAPLAFLITAVFMIGPDTWRDAREGKYSTALWPVLAVPGIWIMVNDSAGGGNLSAAIPEFHILGQELPGWTLGLGAMVITSASYSFANKRLETLEKGIKGQASTLSRLPAVAIVAVSALAMEGGWGGMTNGNWRYLLICAGTGVALALLNGVVVVKAYEKGLRASAVAMLSPLRTLWGILLGMLVEKIIPGPLGFVGIVVILVASYGAAVYQSRK